MPSTCILTIEVDSQLEGTNNMKMRDSRYANYDHSQLSDRWSPSARPQHPVGVGRLQG